MNEWAKVIVPAVILAVLALFWQIIRPALTRLLFYFLNHEDGRLHFRAYHERTMNDLHLQVSTTASAVRTISDRFEQFEFTQKAHGRQLHGIAERLEDVPRLTDSVERLSESVHEFAISVNTLSAWRERVEGREEERRRQQIDNAPRRRQGDPE